MIKLNPSILASDFLNLGKQIELLKKCDVDLLHIDVMDGNFVPNISFGMPIIKSINDSFDIDLDVHLMIEKPERYLSEFSDLGADIITIHPEGQNHLDRCLNHIRSLGKKAGVALNPATPISVLENVLHLCDLVLIMSVNPGFGGQKFIPYTLNKMKTLKEKIVEKGFNILIEVDGGIDMTNIKDVAASGCDIVVAGSSVFKNGEIEKNVKALRELLQ